jgi:phosphoenolpyruvate synthase/pyruvate phosphate dikinase
MGLNLPLVLDFSEINKVDENFVGKRAYELGELSELGIPIPKGFIITTEFYEEFIRSTGIDKDIEKIQSVNHPALSDVVDKLFAPVSRKITYQDLPLNLTRELLRFYKKLSGTFREHPLAISSSNSENKMIAYPNVSGDTNLILKIKKIWATSPTKSPAIIVQESIMPEIKGKIISNELITFDKKISKKQKDKLITYSKAIQKHFYFPQEIEYAISKDRIIVTKLSPVPTATNKSLKRKLSIPRKVLAKGIPINPGIAVGSVKILKDIYPGIKIGKGDVVILPNLDRLIFNKLKNAKAIIIDSIVPNTLNKVIFRNDCRVPAVEGIKNATEIFQNKNIVTVNGGNGEIYPGGLIY